MRLSLCSWFLFFSFLFYSSFLQTFDGDGKVGSCLIVC